MTTDYVDTIAGQPVGVYVEVALERNSQDREWGPQNHPLTSVAWMPASHEQLAGMWKRGNDVAATLGRSSWDGILLEEAYEAFAETDPAKARAELIQVAAVAIAAIESIDRAE